MELGNKDLMCLIIFMTLVSLSVLLWVGPILFEPKTSYDINLEKISQDNKESTYWGNIICSESVNTWTFICGQSVGDDKVITSQWGVSLYNKTQEDFDKLKTECPTGRLVQSTHCIGNDLNINFRDILQESQR